MLQLLQGALIAALLLFSAGTLLVPNVGEARLLSNALGKTTPNANCVLALFTSNTTPAEGDTLATYTKAAGGGYADKTIANSGWTVVAGDPTTAQLAEQTFTFTGALTANATVYGYIMIDGDGTTLWWAERAASTFQPANNGDTYKVTPYIELA